MCRIVCLLCLSLFSFFPAWGNTIDQANAKTIGISQMVEHPALDAVREGLFAALKKHGYEPDKNLKVYYENAQGNIVTSTQIATKLLSIPLDVIVGISTSSAQTVLYAAKRQNNTVPIVFAAVNDAKAAKLQPGESHYPISGITDTPNLEAIVRIMQKMLTVKKLGFLYNPSEPNSVSTLNSLKALVENKGIHLHAVAISSTKDVAQAMQSLIGKADALYLPQDNMVVSAIETVVNIANQPTSGPLGALPLFCNDPLLIERGVLAAVGFDYYEIGKETGEMVVKLLKGEKIKDLPMHNPATLKTVINSPLAEKLKLIIPKL